MKKLLSVLMAAAMLVGVLGYVGAFVLGAYTVFHILVSRHRLLNNEEPR